ncbi:MAG: type II secretion system protein [Phycisphaerae bacterium]|nr:type II secretion system protein [Phycisphaerae bacterium]
MRMAKKGFTLIELLVVIAIIALLLSISLPALRKAKELAAAIPCLANQRAIAQAFYMYSEDNSGWLVTGHAWFTPNDFKNNQNWARSWVACPIDDNGVPYRGWDDPVTAEFEKNGIKAGKLWPYIETLDSYHCPADKRAVKDDVGWRSYSMVASMGAPYGSWVQDGHLIQKMQEIRNPSGKYITVEEIEKKPDGTYWWNMGSWVIDLPANNWFDPLASWHVWGCNLAFADGHAEKKKWEDQRTRDWLQGTAQKTCPGIDNKNPTMNPDLEYMLLHFPHKDLP